jgi:hypothetical protein
MKTCNTCHASKPLDDFYKHKLTADGRLPRCKECQKSAMKDLYREKAKDPAFRRKESLRQKEIAAVRRGEKSTTKMVVAMNRQEWAKLNRKSLNARQAVYKAVKSGKLIRLPCEICGSLKVQAHHEDHSKPLEVRWLCSRHHADRHIEINRIARTERHQ